MSDFRAVCSGAGSDLCVYTGFDSLSHASSWESGVSDSLGIHTAVRFSTVRCERCAGILRRTVLLYQRRVQYSVYSSLRIFSLFCGAENRIRAVAAGAAAYLLPGIFLTVCSMAALCLIFYGVTTCCGDEPSFAFHRRAMRHNIFRKIMILQNCPDRSAAPVSQFSAQRPTSVYFLAVG